MPTSNSTMIWKLQFALNQRGLRVLINRSQFYSEEQKRPITIYKISQSVYNEETNRTNHKEIFSSPSQIQIVLFLRNMWNLVNDKPIPPISHKIKGFAEFENKWAEFADNFKPPT